MAHVLVTLDEYGAYLDTAPLESFVAHDMLEPVSDRSLKMVEKCMAKQALREGFGLDMSEPLVALNLSEHYSSYVRRKVVAQ